MFGIELSKIQRRILEKRIVRKSNKPAIIKADCDCNICGCDNQQPDPLTVNSVCENCGGDILHFPLH